MSTRGPVRWWVSPVIFLVIVLSAELIWPGRSLDSWIITVWSVAALFFMAYLDELRRRRDGLRLGP